MNFEDLSNKVPKIKKLPLPGEAAHFEMAPQMRIDELKALSEKPADYRRAGVMALFYPGPDRLAHLLFILRNTYPGVHSSQIGFPGGQEEQKDRDLLQTALSGVSSFELRVVLRLPGSSPGRRVRTLDSPQLRSGEAASYRSEDVGRPIAPRQLREDVLDDSLCEVGFLRVIDRDLD